MKRFAAVAVGFALVLGACAGPDSMELGVSEPQSTSSKASPETPSENPTTSISVEDTEEPASVGLPPLDLDCSAFDLVSLLAAARPTYPTAASIDTPDTTGPLFGDSGSCYFSLRDSAGEGVGAIAFSIFGPSDSPLWLGMPAVGWQEEDFEMLEANPGVFFAWCTEQGLAREWGSTCMNGSPNDPNWIKNLWGLWYVSSHYKLAFPPLKHPQDGMARILQEAGEQFADLYDS